MSPPVFLDYPLYFCSYRQVSFENWKLSWFSFEQKEKKSERLKAKAHLCLIINKEPFSDPRSWFWNLESDLSPEINYCRRCQRLIPWLAASEEAPPLRSIPAPLPLRSCGTGRSWAQRGQPLSMILLAVLFLCFISSYSASVKGEFFLPFA